MTTFIIVICSIIFVFAVYKFVQGITSTCAICGKKVGSTGTNIKKSKAYVCRECFNKASNAHKESTGLILNAFQVTVEELKQLHENGMNNVVVNGQYFENGRAIDREYYRKCNVCGNIFCFRDSDLRKNEQLAKRAHTARKLAVMESIGGTRLAANQESGQADNLDAQIVDYSVCPKCNSSNLSELTAEQIKAERSSTSNNTLTSSTDELKKLKELLDCGVITQEEFDAKKKQLLGL